MEKNNPHTLGSAPIGKLLLQYSIPAIIGMTLTSLYNIIDSIFIGHGVGALAISGLAITFPLMNLLVAFCTLVGVGGATISSIRLGQKDVKGTEDILGNVTILCVINAIFYGGITLIFLDPILYFFGASESTLPYARDFMQIILLGSPISYVMIGLNNIMRATGYPKKAMLSSMLTVGCNIILAPICIFVLNWGIRGAALSTIASQFIGMIWVLHHFASSKSYIRFKRPSFKLKKKIILNIFSIGMSPFVMNVCACCIGITMGMQPITGYNYGALRFDRVKRTLKLGIIAGTSITTAGFLISELFPEVLVGMFTTNHELTEQAKLSLQIGVMAFPVVGSQIIITQFFQSIGKATVSIFLSLSRQLLFLLPGLALFPPLYGVEGVWFSMPSSDFLAFITALIMLLYHFKQIKKKSLSSAQTQQSNI